jgi:hypothetical protein
VPECGLFLRRLSRLAGCFAPICFIDAAAPAMRKSSAFLPDLIAAVSQRGFNPRPAQVVDEAKPLRRWAEIFELKRLKPQSNGTRAAGEIALDH